MSGCFVLRRPRRLAIAGHGGSWMRQGCFSARAGIALLILISCAGCRSPFIDAAVINHTDSALRTIELDYPGGSFGVSTLAAHARYVYRFKLLGSGPLRLTYNDATGVARAVDGPRVVEGGRGSLKVEIGEGGAVKWEPVLSR